MTKPSVQIQADIMRLNDFRNAYVELINASKRDGESLGYPSLVPKGNADEWQRLRQKTSMAAGAAQPAFARRGGGTILMPMGSRMQSIDPIPNWHMAVTSPEEFDPQLIASTVEHVLGGAAVELEKARSNERGLLGLIAAFLRWPDDLRDAVGGSRKRQRSAKALGVAGQVFVATLSTVLAAAIIGAAGQLLSRLWVG